MFRVLEDIFNLNQIQNDQENCVFLYKLINESFFNPTEFKLGFYKVIENFDENLSTNCNKQELQLN
jgi:hypothetical protein